MITSQIYFKFLVFTDKCCWIRKTKLGSTEISKYTFYKNLFKMYFL